jgi:hypothetical protein
MKCDRGWRLTNYDAYRSRRDDEARREYKARWIKDRRAQSRRVDTCRHDVDNVDSRGHLYTQAEAEAEAEAEVEATASIVVPEKSPASTQAVAVAATDFMDGMQEATAVRKACERRSFADWRTMVAHRIFWTREEDEVWKGIYAAEGWEEMTKAYQYLAGKYPAPKKLFLSMFQEMRG